MMLGMMEIPGNGNVGGRRSWREKVELEGWEMDWELLEFLDQERQLELQEFWPRGVSRILE